MDHPTRILATLAQDLVRIDSRSFVSNLPIADRLARELTGFELERLPYTDDAGIEKTVLVATRGRGGIALSAHMDTVPDTGWLTDPWSGTIDDDALLGLGACDMKGPLAAIVVAAQSLPGRIPVALLITTDEETTKQGAQVILGSELARRYEPNAIIVAEPTQLVPVRGHRSHIEFTATAIGSQAHSATGRGRNANWDLAGFMMAMRTIYERLRSDPDLQDHAYDPPFSDFNPVIDNHGAAVNVTVPRATVRIKFRRSARIDPAPVLEAVRAAAAAAGMQLVERREGEPPELPLEHRIVHTAVELTGKPARTAPYGTDASVLQAMAPCLVLGPGDIAVAHTPHEQASIAGLAASVPLFQRLAETLARA